MKKAGPAAVALCSILLVASLVTAAALNNPALPGPAASQAPASRTETVVVQPAGTRLIGSQAASSAEAALDRAAIETLVSANRVFGEDVYDDEALLRGVEILLLEQSVEIDGFRYLDRELVRRTVFAMYGRTLSETAGEIYGLPAPDGYYAILPCGFEPMTHRITDIQPLSDGRLIVMSQVEIEGLEETETVTAATVLSPAENEYGYIITAVSTVEG